MPTDRFIVWPELEALIPYSRQHVWRLEAQGLFPRRRCLSANRIAWVESEILGWIASRQRGGPPQKTDLAKQAPAPEPDAEELVLLRQIAAKHGLDLVPTRPERRRRGGSLP